MPSIKDVAREAGVSITTVSMVLNNKGNISPETRERVLQVINEMSYTRNIIARNLRENEARIIGYAWDMKRSNFNPVMDNFLYELVRRSEAVERHLLLFAPTHDDPVGIYRHLIETRRVDGFILSHTNQNDERFKYLYESGFPFVAFGRSASPLDDITCWVDVDGKAGLYAATSHLIAQGHRKIAFLGWPIGSVSGDSRYAGYVQALEEHNIPLKANWILRYENDIIAGYDAGQYLMSIADRPTALVAVSDILAVGAMRCFHEKGTMLAISGFDNTPIGEFTNPPLTSVRQPVEKVAQLLIDMLISQLNHENIPNPHHLLAPELIIRQSSLR